MVWSSDVAVAILCSTTHTWRLPDGCDQKGQGRPRLVCNARDRSKLLCACMLCALTSHISRVGQNHIFIRIYGVHTVFLAGKSPYIQSYTVQIYGSGQPYTYFVRLRIKLHIRFTQFETSSLVCAHIYTTLHSLCVVCVSVCVYVCVYVCLCLSVCLCLCVWIHGKTPFSCVLIQQVVCLCLSVCLCLCVCVCIHGKTKLHFPACSYNRLSLKHLDLGGNPLGDQGLTSLISVLPQLQCLRGLSLRQTSLTDWASPQVWLLCVLLGLATCTCTPHMTE